MLPSITIGASGLLASYDVSGVGAVGQVMFNMTRRFESGKLHHNRKKLQGWKIFLPNWRVS